MHHYVIYREFEEQTKPFWRDDGSGIPQEATTVQEQ